MKNNVSIPINKRIFIKILFLIFFNKSMIRLSRSIINTTKSSTLNLYKTTSLLTNSLLLNGTIMTPTFDNSITMSLKYTMANKKKEDKDEKKKKEKEKIK